MNFVIWAPEFDDQVGGVMALHLLCHRLNEAGHNARIWPAHRTSPLLVRTPKRFLGWLRYHLTKRDQKFQTGPFPRRLARYKNLKDAVVVYPEIVAGNPLRARHVVRWLLYKPGFHTGVSDYRRDDLFFFYMQAFNDPSWNQDEDNELRISWTNPIYRDEEQIDRSGSCYLVRKGTGRPLLHDAGSAVPIDGLYHRETAAVFNRCDRLFCYDLYTRYYYYAALCGCVPVVVPQPGLSREQWMPDERDRYGVAYGEDDVDWAIATRSDLIRRLAEDEEAERQQLDRFLQKCQARFFAKPSTSEPDVLTPD